MVAMTNRGVLIFCLLTIGWSLAIVMSYRLDPYSDLWGIEAVLVDLLWTFMRVVLLSLRGFNWKLSAVTAIAGYLEWAAMLSYTRFEEYDRFHPGFPYSLLQQVLVVAISGFVLGRIVDFYILKPYFPRRSTIET